MSISDTIVNIYTGQPKTIIHEGKTQRTSLFNRKEEDTIVVTFEGIKGNQLADAKYHGGLDRIAYIYSKEDYRYWSEKRKDLHFTHGIFGENLLTENAIPENMVFIGDRFRIGSTYFSVSGPRLPCNKLGIKMKSKSFINEFLTVGKTGFYLRLEKEGTIKKGDPIERVSSADEKLSVLDVSKLFFQFNQTAVNQVKSSIHLASDLKRHILDKYSVKSSILI